MKIYFSLRQIPEMKDLPSDEFKKLSRQVSREVLVQAKTLLGLVAIVLLASPVGYWTIVEVDSEPASTILTILAPNVFWASKLS